MRRTILSLSAVVLLLAVLVVSDPPPASSAPADRAQNGTTVRHPEHADTSPPLRDITPRAFGTGRIIRPEHEPPSAPTGGSADPVVQASPSTASAAPATTSSFEGVGAGLSGFNVQYSPPDTDGDVGPNHYVQVVNVGLAVFNKSGTVVLGPEPTNTVFRGFGGGCETNNDGDATVKYDRQADRWLISQFSVSTKPYLQCLALSVNGDPTGAYRRYSFAMGSNFPDYPKLGVWSDAYYTTFNMFNGNTFVGAEVCAYNRAALLSGSVDVASATQVCVVPSGAASLLPSDIEGATAPSPTTPDFLLTYGTNSLKLWKYRVDWTSNSAILSGPTSIAGVAAFTAACNGGTCIPQYGTSQKLDSLADRLMYRLSYRNIGGIERLVVSHAVNPGNGTSAVRWYEVRDPNGTPTVFQQGTYAPDSKYRWMSSAAIDGAGNIALGYSISSGGMNPAIGYAAHQSTDSLGALGTETVLIAGTGSQTTSLSRWGDYSNMSVDPIDDCTFWYTNEYLASNGTWNWHTRVGTFRLSSCPGTPPAPDFAVSVTPSSQTVTPGTSANYTVTVTPTSTYAGTVNLTTTLGTLSPTSLTFLANGTSQPAALTVAATTTAGTTAFTVTASDGLLTHNAGGSLTVASASTRIVTVTAGAKKKSLTPVTVTWNGYSTAPTVDVSRNGGSFTSTSNTGSLTENWRGSGTVTYTVCEAADHTACASGSTTI